MNKISYYFIQISIICLVIVTTQVFVFPKIFLKDEIHKSISSGWDSSYSSPSIDSGWDGFNYESKPEKNPVKKKLSSSYKPQKDTLAFQDMSSLEKELNRASKSPTLLDNIVWFFAFTSNIIGTIFPVIGFIMTMILWKNQKKLSKES